MAMWRQFTAWIGGVGIIVLFLAVLPRLRIGGRQALFRTESAGPEIGLADTIRESARRFVVLYVGDHRARDPRARDARAGPGVDPRMDLFQRRRRTRSPTIATAGFSTEARSIEPFAPATQWAIIVLHGRRGHELRADVRRRSSAAPCGRSRATRSSASTSCCSRSRRRSCALELLTEDIFSGEAAVRHAVFNVVVDDDHDRLRERRLQRVDAADRRWCSSA